MRFLLVPLLGIFLSCVAYSADNATTEGKIKTLLTTPKSWTMYLEYTDAPTPSDRAMKFTWEYFERDGKVSAAACRAWPSATVIVKFRCELTDSVFDGAIRS